MYLDKMIKRELLVLIVSVVTILIIVFGIFYIKNSNMNNDINNTIKVGDLSIKYCTDNKCNKTISNFGNTIGTNNVDGESKVKYIEKLDDIDALNKKPYVFNIRNNGKDTVSINISIKEDDDYKPYDNIDDLKKITELYSNSIKIGITNCSNEDYLNNVEIKHYNELVDNTLLYNQVIESGNDNTYCMWTWIDNNLEEEIDKSYFVAKLSFDYELK